MNSPIVSVIVPVFNGVTSITDCLKSLRIQTLEDIEIIVIDDGSTDFTSDAVKAIEDPRIRLVQRQNGGVASARNLGIDISRGHYIAFQDHDDLSEANRLQMQVDYLTRNPDVGLLGSRSTIIGKNGRVRGGHDHPLSDAELRFELMLDNPFVTSSIMTRRNVLEDVGRFTLDQNRQPEDFELWSRISRRYKVANLPDRLVIYRETVGSLSTTHVSKRLAHLAAENMAAVFGKGEPDIHMLDLGFWQHASYANLSEKPEFREMFDILVKARDRIATDRTEKRDISRSIDRHLYELITARPAKYLPCSLRLKRRLLRLKRNLARIVKFRKRKTRKQER